MANQWAMERAFYDIFERDQRIAALEAQIARLTAEPSDEDVEAAWDRAWEAFPGKPAIKSALTAFLERRMKG